MESFAEYSSDKGVLTLSGELIVDHTPKLQELLINALNQIDHLKIDLVNITKIDFTVVQLLCSANQTFQASGKQISFSDNDGSRLLFQTSRDAGFIRKNTDCAQQDCHPCLFSDPDM